MTVIVVGGNGRSAGKTTLICGLIAALPEFRWTAVKITVHAHGRPETTWEETTAGQGTDTARYLAAGARRALLVNAPDTNFPIAEIQAALGPDSNVIFESNRIVNYLQPHHCLAVIGGPLTESKPSFQPLLQRADAVVISSGADTKLFLLPPAAPLFHLAHFEPISPEMLAWLRSRLSHQEAALALLLRRERLRFE